MEVLRTLQTQVANDTDTQQLDNWARGLPADGLYVQAEMPVTVGTAGTPALSDLKNLLDYFMARFSLSYGDARQYKPYQAVPGHILRNIHRLMTASEVWSDFVGVAQTTGAKTFRARLFVTPQRQKSESSGAAPRRIGWTQGRLIEVKNDEGAALTAGALNLSRTAGSPCLIKIIPRYAVGDDAWSHFPHYREVNRNALDLQGPDGLMLAFWDDNAAFASTALGKYSLRLGDIDIIRLMEPSFFYVDYARLLDVGAPNISDEETLLWAADPFAPDEQLVPGAPYFKLVTQDVAQLKGRFLYYPAVSGDEAKAVVQQVAMARNENVVATLPEPPNNPANNGVAASAPLRIVPQSDERYEGATGVRAGPNLVADVHVPAKVTGQARALASISAAEQRKYAKQVSLRVPGATQSNGRGHTNDLRRKVREQTGG